MGEEYIHEYIFSGSLPENASTYVTREADDELYNALRQGKFCYVLNSRQSGKSSLRVRTMSRLLEGGVECASIDLSSVSIQSATQENWYADLIVKLIDSFDLDVDFQQWWEKNQLNSSLMKFGNFLEKILLTEIQEKIVIFIDEIDSVLSLKFPTDDFFAFIRSCYNQRVDNPEYNRLTFCLLGVASPSNLIEDKQRTPFNIGKAISLKGFQPHEVEPLQRGLEGKCSNPQAVMQEILEWTGGQPFLTQKLCQFMVEESEKENFRSVEQVVKSRIIENWESQDEPEHLRTIQARILRDEQRAGYLLELYQQIRLREEQSEITADDTLEQSELQLSGLVVRQQNKFRVYNPIYKEVFDQNWVENQLRNLRPYSENFRFWVASGGSDESRLLREKALQEAELWATDKSLSYQDRQFLAASKEKEIQEEIAAREKEAVLERERKDKEAVEKSNKVLTEANKKAQRLIWNGTIILFLTVLGAVISGTIAAKKVLDAENKLQETYTYVATPEQLKKLARRLRPESEQAIEISKKADIKINDLQLEQGFLHASKSLAHQYLYEGELAEESIKISMQFLRGWEHSKMTNSNNEFLQTKIFALNTQGNLLRRQNNTLNRAKAAYQEAFDILQKHPTLSSLQSAVPKILDSKDIESVHRGLIKLLSTNNTGPDLRKQVEQSLTQHLYAQLKYYLKAKDWEAADRQTDQLMLYVAQKEEQGYLGYDDINNFSCPDLKEINKLWVESDKRFGFSVQKEIWIKTGNRLGIKLEDWTDEDYDNYLRFAKTVGWYDDKKVDETAGSKGDFLDFVRIDDLIERIKDNSSYGRGSLPRGVVVVWLRARLIVLLSRVATCKL